LLSTIRHKLAQTISKIEPPPSRSIAGWLKESANEAKSFDLDQPSYFSIAFDLVPTQASENICLQIIESITEIVVLVERDNKTISFLIEQRGEEDRIEALTLSGSIEQLRPLKSEISRDLLPIVPSVSAIETKLLTLPKLFRTTNGIFVLKAETTDFSQQYLLPAIQLSINLLVPLGKLHTDGKDYRRHEQSLYGDIIPVGDQPIQRVRKAYSVRKTPYSTQIRHQNIWDLIFPLLQPPLTLEVTEQFDLYQPLYGYQQKGVEFLIENTSALLADEMGTGKTVQTIVALRVLFRQAKVKHALILCPPSILGSAYLSQITGKPEGWDGHFHKWAPELSVTVVRGNPEQRRLDWSCPAHVYISTYDTLRNDLETGLLEEREINKFDCVITDEAQNIKNRDTGRAKAVRKLNPAFRWALTGTPIENKVEDVISIFAFVRPKLFSREYHPPHEVKHHIEPYFLRRLKKDVLKDLPDKTHQEEWLELDGDQRAAYDRALVTGQRQLSDKVKTESEFQVRRHIFSLLQELKQICNFAPKKASSPKTDALLDHVETLAENNDKVLIFSQYDEYGIGKLEQCFQNNSIKFVTYRGGMSDQERDQAIRSFKTIPDITVFLGSVRTAGFGLTLTEASYVIHFDHWWNPAVMWQAEDRAHRPGQINKLNIYSFWMKDTIEEKIKQKLHEKGLLIESIIDSLAEEEIEEMISTNEWLEILGVKKADEQEESRRAESFQVVLEELRQMSPTDFEEITREFFVKQGYANSKVTQRSYDGGIDVFGSRQRGGTEESFVAQCKRTSSVGVRVARELLGILAANQKITNGFIITSGEFTEECLRFAGANPKLALINGITFAKYLVQFKIL
jgi:superfamily II DNA or RNA helicase